MTRSDRVLSRVRVAALVLATVGFGVGVTWLRLTASPVDATIVGFEDARRTVNNPYGNDDSVDVALPVLQVEGAAPQRVANDGVHATHTVGEKVVARRRGTELFLDDTVNDGLRGLLFSLLALLAVVPALLWAAFIRD